MNTLYIPNIGDRITLAVDWNVALEPLSCNDALAEANGYMCYWNRWVEIAAFPKEVTIVDTELPVAPKYEDYKILSWVSMYDTKAYNKAMEEYNAKVQQAPSVIARLKVNQERAAFVKTNGLTTIPITIPAQTVLIVDTIYARQWHKKQGISTITFRTELNGVPGHKIKVKFQDTANIQY